LKPEKRHIFFVGIGGVGMSGIADIMLARGYRVSGSDRQSSAITEYLERRGAVVHIGHRKENIAADVEIVVYSSAVPAENPERTEARSRGLIEVRRAEMLADIILDRQTIAMAGTHGKTTTTSMVYEVLLSGDLDPTVLVGGRLRSSLTNARAGEGPYAVVEADEYDRSFLALRPVIAVLNNLEADHLDIYEDLDDLRKTFVQFAHRTPFFGTVALCSDDANLRGIRGKINRRIVSYGMGEDAEIRAGEIVAKGTEIRFAVSNSGEKLGTINLKVPGNHNVLNALAAVTVGIILEIPFAQIKRGLEKFTGVERRFDFRGETAGIRVYDDYAHHPSEVRATLDAAVAARDKRIIAVFQPHLFSRTRDFYREFAEALSHADMVVVTDVYPAREEPIPGVDGNLIADACWALRRTEVHYVADKKAVPEFLRAHCRAGDLVLTMGAGDIWQAGEKLLQELN
jgi:UDP-N-acetylmuramate--alanine ligase